MANNDKLPYLSEIIDLERDILPHRVALLHAGVGAGKNTWTKILAQKGYRILLITSRRVTADMHFYFHTDVIAQALKLSSELCYIIRGQKVFVHNRPHIYLNLLKK